MNGLTSLITLLAGIAFTYAAYEQWQQGSLFGAIMFMIFALPTLGSAIRLFAGKDKPFGNELSSDEIAELKSNGKKITAAFKMTDRRWNIKIQGQPPLVVYAADDAGRQYESQNIWASGGNVNADDPLQKALQLLQSPDPSKKYWIPIYIDPQDPQKYWMDVAGLEVK